MRDDGRYLLIIDYGGYGRTESYRWRLKAYTAADSILLINKDLGCPVRITVKDQKKGKVLRKYGQDSGPS